MKARSLRPRRSVRGLQALHATQPSAKQALTDTLRRAVHAQAAAQAAAGGDGVTNPLAFTVAR
jgi:hypothetical protein